MDWAKSPEPRDQGVLYPVRLDDAISEGHSVRLLNEILSQLDWSDFESRYERQRGQPPIHPRILASVILYGLMKRVISSRALEEALQVRLDFRWLAEGMSIDHSTLNAFRSRNSEPLKNLFVQVGMVARQIGCLPLETLAFDGTRIRANNRRTRARSPERLLEMQRELAKKFQELQDRSAELDAKDNEILGDQSGFELPKELASVKRRLKEVEAALKEIDRMKAADQKIPARVPLTDPQSRITPNKDGGFAPNYTPLATVDAASGFIVSTDVISNTDEDKHLAAAIDDVQEQFGLDAPPAKMLADSLNATGDNLAKCAERGVELYAPLKNSSKQDNPAVRDDPSQPVRDEDVPRLPMKTETRAGQTTSRFDKTAFVYDESEDAYWCPAGKKLPYVRSTSETRYGTKRNRKRYQSSPDDCSGCPLLKLCLTKGGKQRSINRERHASLCDAHAKKMATDEAQEKYARRRHVGERPFAVIKRGFGVLQFLRRGLSAVRDEWRWLATGFNLQLLVGLMRNGVGPPPVPT